MRTTDEIYPYATGINPYLGALSHKLRVKELALARLADVDAVAPSLRLLVLDLLALEPGLVVALLLVRLALLLVEHLPDYRVRVGLLLVQSGLVSLRELVRPSLVLLESQRLEPRLLFDERCCEFRVLLLLREQRRRRGPEVADERQRRREGAGDERGRAQRWAWWRLYS